MSSLLMLQPGRPKWWVLAQADAQALFVRVVYWFRSLLAFPMSCWPP